jgi:Cholesterol oxidase, substrate-binding
MRFVSSTVAKVTIEHSLAHLGRAFLLDATLEVIDNYNMRCQSFVGISPNVLFQAPTPESSNGHESLMTFLQTTGRAEVLWYPLSDKAWLKVWTVTKSKPHTSTAVKLPYNYPFSHNMSKFQGLFLKTVIQLWPSLTPRFSRMCTDVIAANLLRSASDLSGPSKNSFLYARETTTRLTMSGHAVHIRRLDIQAAVHDFTVKISALLKAYANNSRWPINGPVEIRVTGLDDPSTVVVGSGMAAQSPTASSLVFDNLCTKHGWDVAVWFNVLTSPGTKASNEFYTELESCLQERFSGDRGRPLCRNGRKGGVIRNQRGRGRTRSLWRPSGKPLRLHTRQVIGTSTYGQCQSTTDMTSLPIPF